MAKEKTRYDWGHTSAILATLINLQKASGDIIPLNAFIPGGDKPEKVSEEEIITDPELKRQLRGRIHDMFAGT